MSNLIFNSTTQKSVKLSTNTTEAIFRGIVILGSRIAETTWQKETVIWFSEHNQNLLGIGVAGLDITRMGWSKEDFAVQKEFILRVLQGTILCKSWNAYVLSVKEDAYAAQKTMELAALFEELQIEDIHPGPLSFIFRQAQTTTYRYCDRHQILLNDAPVESNQNCMVCGTTEIDETIGLKIREIELEGEWNYRFCFDITPAEALHSKDQVYKIADRICLHKDFTALGNLWHEIDEEVARQGLRDGFTYDLAYSAYKIETEEIRNANIEKALAPLQNQEILCCLTNTEKNPWHSSGGWGQSELTPAWTFNYAYVIGCRNKIIFAFFTGED